jgi:phosphatidylglycerophosphate synthase
VKTPPIANNHAVGITDFWFKICTVKSRTGFEASKGNHMDFFISIVGVLLTCCLFVFFARVLDVALERNWAGDVVFAASMIAVAVALALNLLLKVPVWSLIPGIIVGTVVLVAALTGLTFGAVYLVKNCARIGQSVADRLGYRMREMIRDHRANRDDAE